MVASKEPPNDKVGAKGGQAKAIPLRKLGDLNVQMLEQLLRKYEAKLKAIRQERDTIESSQNNAEITVAETDRGMEYTTAEIRV